MIEPIMYLGIGFLAVRVAACSDQLSDWLDLAHYFRFMQGRRGTGVSATGSAPPSKQKKAGARPAFCSLERFSPSLD